MMDFSMSRTGYLPSSEGYLEGTSCWTFDDSFSAKYNRFTPESIDSSCNMTEVRNDIVVVMYLVKSRYINILFKASGGTNDPGLSSHT